MSVKLVLHKWLCMNLVGAGCSFYHDFHLISWLRMKWWPWCIQVVKKRATEMNVYFLNELMSYCVVKDDSVPAHTCLSVYRWSSGRVLMAPYANALVQVKRQSVQDQEAEKRQIFKHIWQMKPSLTFERALTGCRDWVVENNPPLSNVTQAQQ